MRNTSPHMTLPVYGLLFYVLVTGVYASPLDETSVRSQEKLIQWHFCADTSPDGSEPSIPQQAEWTTLAIPHVFRLSGLPEQSAGWYRRTFTAGKDDQNQCLYLRLEGAGSVADVYVNGQHIGSHRGAFTAAVFDLTPAVKFGQDNDLLVRVSNRDTEAANCLSQSNLFYTNGGLYRPAWLIKTRAVHIYPDMGSSGIYLTPKNITPASADLEVKTYLRNSEDRPLDVPRPIALRRQQHKPLCLRR